MTKKQRILSVLLALILLLSVITVTYAFFTASTSNDNQEVLSVSAGTLKLTFSDVGSSSLTGEMNFGDSKTASFSIANEGNVDTYAKIDWNGITNSYLSGSLVYTLSYATSQSGTYTNVVTNQNVPTSTSAQVLTLKDGLLIPANTTYYYKITITLVYSQTVDQTADLSATFKTGFKIEQGSEPAFKIISGNLSTVGSEVAIGTENFYVISSDSTNVNLLAKYNLDITSTGGTTLNNTGLQDSNVKGWVSSGTTYGTIAFSSSSYWSSYSSCFDSSNSYCNNSYPWIYDSNSNLYTYVNSYVNTLNSKYSAGATGRLMSYEEVRKITGVSNYGTISSTYAWVYNTSFWLGSACGDNYVWLVYSDGSFNFNRYYSSNGLGVRPVVTVSKSLF